ncbi:MAG: gamma-glutamyltransferase [Gemmatimonadetes bacterium]|nr:gamma-glutamyltransferase [Gemmatimonadota bacterium]
MRPLPLRAPRRLLAFALASVTACQASVDPPAEMGHEAVFPETNRPEVRGTRGAVSSDHPLATAVGLDVLRRGGNATDAVIAMAGVLAVVRPHMNGVGGDAFGLFYQGESGEVVALNGSGGAGAKATPEFFRELGHDAVPETGPLSVSVPGAVAAWEAALSRFGTLSLGALLEPARRYADEGFPVTTRLASDFQQQGGALNDTGRAKYLPGGGPPETGTLLTNRALAQTLTTIGEGGAAAFYGGPIGQRLAAYVDSLGGTLSGQDFAGHEPEWVEPISADYLGYRLHVLPPNTQGVAQLAYARMSNALPLKEMGHNTSTYLHALIELKKLAFADRDAWVGDPRHASIPLEALLDETYLAERSGQWDPARAAASVTTGVDGSVGAASPDGRDDGGDTVYLTAVDQWGNAVSWIQSLFHGFGSGLLEPETGVVLHNRGSLYTLQDGHPNQVAPGKRPYHTLTPLLATRTDGGFAFTLGTPGGDSQTQSLLQIMNNMELFGMTPQAAIEAPRFRSNAGLSLAIEDRVAPEVVAELRELGHEVSLVAGWTATFGGAQMILMAPSGTLVAAADPRREAYALAY